MDFFANFLAACKAVDVEQEDEFFLTDSEHYPSRRASLRKQLLAMSGQPPPQSPKITRNAGILVQPAPLCPKKPKRVCNRWVRLFVFSLVLAVNNMLWMSFSAIKPDLEARYGLSGWAVTWFSLIFMVLYPVGAYPAAWTSEYNTTIPVLICAALGALGAMIRCFATTPDLYWLLYLGQIFPALGQPFAVCLPPKITSRWFKPSEREVSCTIGCLAAPAGVIVAFILTPLFDLPNSTNFTSNNQFIQAVIAVAVFLLAALIYRDPEHDQTLGDDINHNQEDYQALAESLGLPVMQMGPISAWDGIRHCFKSLSILLLIFMFGVSQGSFLTIGTIINDLLPRYSGQEQSLFAALTVLGGFVGSAINIVVLRRTKGAHKKIMIVSMAMVIEITTIIIASLPYHNAPLIAITCFLTGFFVFPNMMIAYELSVEMTFMRADESLVAGLCQMAAQVIAIVQILIVTPMLAKNNGVALVWLIILISFALALVATFFIKVKTLRMDAEMAGVAF